MAYQQQVQMKLNKQEQIDIQLLRSQLDSLFEIFQSILALMKFGDSVDEDIVMARTDLAVSTLKMFGATCQDHKKKKEGNTLRAAWAYFERESKQFGINSTDAQRLAPWLQYIECALVSTEPLPKLKISKQTIDSAEKNMVGGLGTFLNRFLGANHHTSAKVKEVDNNAAKYADKHRADIQGSRRQYNARQKMMKWPSQNDMYAPSGRGQNIKFGNSVYSKPKYAAHGDVNMGNGTTVSDDDDDDDDQMMGGMDPIMPKIQVPMNALIKSKPPKTLKIDGQKLKLKYPFGCLVETMLANDTVGVVLAAPFQGCKARIAVSNIETSKQVVRRWERKYISSTNHGHGLGYLSIDETERKKQKKQQNFIYQ